MRDLQLQGQVPDTHRFLRLVAKLGCGLAAPLQKDLRQAAEKIFAAAGWMERMAVWASEQGFTLNVTRVYCSAVCIFHRRGLPELALQAVEALRARNAEVPICTLSLAIDACLQAGWSDKACELFKEAKMLVSQKLAAAQQNEAVEEADVEDSDSDGEKPGKDGDPCPEPEESSLRTDGMPPWLSPREGHLVALIACHVAILNHLALHPGYWTGEAPAEPKPGAFSAVSLVRDGLEVVQSACSLAEKPCPGASALLGQIDGLGRRRQKALRLLLAPCARLTQLPEAEPELAELVTGAGLEAASLATAGLMETAAVQRVEDFGDEISEQDALDVRSNVLSLLRRLERPLCREDLDEQIRAMGRRKIKRPGMILQTFRVMAQLAARGQSALEPGVAKAMRHMPPDQDSCAATVEALFACGSVDAAEEIYRRCRAALLPNPALYSAMIFGRLACGDGDGATEAMLDMAAAGFTPHQRFLSRSLRFMGPFHNQGLLLVERLGLPHLQQKLLHVLMEACNNSPNPAESALEVYRFMAKEWVPTPDTHFAMLKALCGTEVDLAICELRSFQAQEVLPPHPGFELLLRECFGLANRRHRACLVMEARRAWVEEVSAMAPCELRHLVTMGQELQKRMEAIVPETKEHYWDAEQVWEADPEADQYAEEGQADRPRKCSEDGDPAMLDDSCFGPNCCYRWVLETYCAALPLHLAAVNAVQYVVWRYSLVRSGVQKALLQQELDQALTGDHARTAFVRSKALGGVAGIRFLLRARLVASPACMLKKVTNHTDPENAEFMGRWDVVLPFLAPGRGALPSRGSQRERVEGSPRSVSPQSSASSAADDRLPNVEDIYDLLTSDLVQLEEKLAAKGSESLTLKEEKLHGLIKVELGERRGVEEIGLALIGGRFDLGSIGLAKEASPCVGSPLAPSASAPSASPTASASASPVVRQVPKAAQVWTLPDASPMSSRSSLRTPSPRLHPLERSLSTGTAQPKMLPKAFKPTPVDFDFVIGNSSVKKGTRRPKKEPKPKDTNPKGSREEREEPDRRNARPEKRASSRPKKPKEPREPREPSKPRGPKAEAKPKPKRPKAGQAGYPSQAVPAPSAVEESVELREDLPDERSMSPKLEGAVPGILQERGTSEGFEDAEQEGLEGVDHVDHEPDGLEPGKDPEQNDLKEGLEPDVHEIEYSFELSEGEHRSRQVSRSEVIDSIDVVAEHAEAGPDDSEALGESIDAASEHELPEHRPESDDSAAEDEPLSGKASDVPASRASTPALSSRPQSSQVERRESEDASGKDGAAVHTETFAPSALAEDGRPCTPEGDMDGVKLKVSNIGPTASSPPTRVLREPTEESPKEVAKAKAKPRKPPLPHDALRATPAKSCIARGNELDFVGLDPSLVERGGVRSYQEHFGSFVDIFTWSQSEASQKERYLREALQLFTQFCNVIGSLETQFASKLPAEHATPNATNQVLNAMASRGAGLYGVFLKGIIDKMDAAPVPRPLPVDDVYTLRYYKVVQNRTEVYDIVTRVFHRKEGWEELPHGLGLSNAWNLCWTWSKPKLDYSRLCVWQKVNHFPENKHLTRKDCLKRCIDRYTRTGGKLAQFFNICPKTFVLPKEYCAFIESFTKIAEENGDLEGSTCPPSKVKVPNMWIMKPAGSSRGRGIEVIDDIGAVHYGELTIIQQYISDPFLLGGLKWDMRTYVTVTSFNPLEAFVYKDGFARFTTVPYNTSSEDIDNKFVHLTNSSIQRHNEDNFMQEEGANATRREDALLGGTKISFGMLQERLKACGVEWATVWAKMVEVILKSLCMAEDHIPFQVNSFELFGYDLMIDSKMKVWLIEVNSSPSMGQEHLLDEQVKQPLINDTIDLVQPMEFDRRRLTEVLHRRVERKGATGATGGRQQRLGIRCLMCVCLAYVCKHVL
ncbi:unnamed protein product [Effrenium voratum]|nr:unnamed protein product [Effrenium voratum]